MATVELVMPKMGESIMEATILKWHKHPGDTVKMDETVLDIATDKVDTEVPSTAAGIVAEVLFQVNDVVPVGAVIARINTVGSHHLEQQNWNPGNLNNGPGEKKEEVVNYQQVRSATPAAAIHQEGNQKQPVFPIASQQEQNNHNNRFYSPLVLNIASQEGISLSELEKIKGTGNDGRVSKKDILEYMQRKNAGGLSGGDGKIHQAEVHTPSMESPVRQVTDQQLTTRHAQLTPSNENVEIIEMDRMRKLIADHMVRSKHTSPHVTSFTEADVTNMVMWRERSKKDFEKREGTKITFTPLFIEAIVRCIKKFPLINSSVEGNNILLKKDINIGMATALPGGNLIVPVIRNADQLNLVGLSKKVNFLADQARNNKLRPDDISDGTFTVTNVGTFGSLMGTPIINQPQVAILAVGAIKKRPVVVETPHGDSIAIRHMMYLSMSYDHRIIDGSLGATFLTAVANELENFNAQRES